MRVLLCGAPSALEREMGAAIMRHARTPVSNRIGADTLPQLLALLARATVLLSPDSGPVHMATMVGTPVIGLYAATNPARTGPYLSRAWCIDAYAQAAERFRGRARGRTALDHEDRGPGRHGPDRGAAGHRETRRLARITAMTDLHIPVSPGELLDKITILRIKSQRIHDAAKVANVRLELELLERTWATLGAATPAGGRR